MSTNAYIMYANGISGINFRDTDDLDLGLINTCVPLHGNPPVSLGPIDISSPMTLGIDLLWSDDFYTSFQAL